MSCSLAFFLPCPPQQRELTNTKTKLEEELQEIKGLLEEKREHLKRSKEQEKVLEGEIEALRQEAKKKEKMVRGWDLERSGCEPGAAEKVKGSLGAQERRERRETDRGRVKRPEEEEEEEEE